MKTPEEIAQWVINNRYSQNEKQKVSDAEMYHNLVDSIANLCNLPDVIGQSEQLKAFNEQMSIDHHWYMPVPEEDIDRYIKSL